MLWSRIRLHRTSPLAQSWHQPACGSFRSSRGGSLLPVHVLFRCIEGGKHRQCERGLPRPYRSGCWHLGTVRPVAGSHLLPGTDVRPKHRPFPQHPQLCLHPRVAPLPKLLVPLLSCPVLQRPHHRIAGMETQDEQEGTRFQRDADEPEAAEF